MPAKKTMSARLVSKIKVMGMARAVPSLIKLMTKVPKEATAICVKPSMAEAVPAFLPKGASAAAVAVGTTKATPEKTMLMGVNIVAKVT